jgi:outer membrane protein assembly factor BamB
MLAFSQTRCQNYMKRIIIILSGLAFITLPAVAGPQDWPQWRGANRDAKVAGFDAPKTWPDQLHQNWKVEVGRADATPALVGDRLYVFSRQETDEVTQCLDAATGKQIWVDKNTVKPLTGGGPGEHPGPRSSPTVGEGKVVTLGVRGDLSCLDAATGKVIWRKNDFPGQLKFFTSMSPIIVHGLCVAHLGSETNGAIVAYDLKSGNQKWQWTGDGPAYDSPVLLALGKAKLIVSQTAKKIVAINLADGKLAWDTDFAPKGMAQNTATPIVDGQTVIYTGAGRGTVAVKLEKTGDTITAKPLWSNPDLSPRFASPVLKNGLLYGLSQKGQFYCIDEQTGKTAWVENGDGRGGGFGSIVDAGPVLMALTPKEQLIIFQPTDKDYTQLASIKVADTPTYGYPVVAGKRIFVEDQDSVTLWTLE